VAQLNRLRGLSCGLRHIHKCNVSTFRTKGIKCYYAVHAHFSFSFVRLAISFSGITCPWAAGGQCHGFNKQLNLLQIYHCLLNRYFCAFMGEMNGVSALHVRSHPYLYVIHTGPIQVDSRQPHGPLYDPQGFRNLNISFTRKREGSQKVQTSKNDNIIR